MPAITVSSVNTGTEELTVTAHGLLTGDRFRLRNVGGALPAATPTLAAVTDYFAVVTGVNTIKVSDTNPHALAGTNIVNLTGSGSGTTTLEYGLPYSIPNEIMVDGVSQIHAKDLNGSWTSLVALHGLLTQQAQSIWTYSFNRQFFPSCWSATGTPPTLVANPASGPVIEVWKIPTGQTVRTRIPYEGGATLKTFAIDVFGDGAVDWVGNVNFSTDMTGSSGFGAASTGATISNQSAAWTRVGSFVVSGGAVLAADGVLEFELVVSGGTFLHVGGIYLGFQL